MNAPNTSGSDHEIRSRLASIVDSKGQLTDAWSRRPRARAPWAGTTKERLEYELRRHAAGSPKDIDAIVLFRVAPSPGYQTGTWQHVTHDGQARSSEHPPAGAYDLTCQLFDELNPAGEPGALVVSYDRNTDAVSYIHDPGPHSHWIYTPSTLPALAIEAAQR